MKIAFSTLAILIFLAAVTMSSSHVFRYFLQEKYLRGIEPKIVDKDSLVSDPQKNIVLEKLKRLQNKTQTLVLVQTFGKVRTKNLGIFADSIFSNESYWKKFTRYAWPIRLFTGEPKDAVIHIMLIKEPEIIILRFGSAVQIRAFFRGVIRPYTSDDLRNLKTGNFYLPILTVISNLENKLEGSQRFESPIIGEIISFAGNISYPNWNLYNRIIVYPFIRLLHLVQSFLGWIGPVLMLAFFALLLGPLLLEPVMKKIISSLSDKNFKIVMQIFGAITGLLDKSQLPRIWAEISTDSPFRLVVFPIALLLAYPIITVSSIFFSIRAEDIITVQSIVGAKQNFALYSMASNWTFPWMSYFKVPIGGLKFSIFIVVILILKDVFNGIYKMLYSALKFKESLLASKQNPEIQIFINYYRDITPNGYDNDYDWKATLILSEFRRLLVPAVGLYILPLPAGVFFVISEFLDFILVIFQFLKNLVLQLVRSKQRR